MKHLCTHVESDFVESPTTKEDATSVQYFEEMLENAAKLPQKVARTSLLGAFKELRMRSNVDSKLAVVLRQLVDLELCSDLSNDELETAANSSNDELRWAAREALVLRDNKSVAGVIVQECRSELLGFKGGVAKEEDIAAMFDRGFRVLSRSKNLVSHANEIVDILATAPASVVNKVVADWQFICPVNRKAEQVLAELLRGNNRSSWTLDQRTALVRSLTNASGKQSEVAKKEFAAVLGQLCNSELSAATEPALLQCLDGLDGVSASGDLAVALNKVAEDVRISHDLRLRACRRLIQNNAIGIQANEFLRSEWMELLATNHRAPVVGAQSYFSDVGTTDTLWRPMAIYALRDASDRSPEAADMLRVLRKSSIGEMRRCAMK
jgi:hypothetical protein